MVQVTCEKTGLTFEASSARTRNHPRVMTIVNEANKDGWYTQCLETLRDGRNAGLDTLEDFLDLLAQAKKSAASRKMEEYHDLLAQKRKDRERRQAAYQAYRNGNVERVDDELDSGLAYQEMLAAQTSGGRQTDIAESVEE